MPYFLALLLLFIPGFAAAQASDSQCFTGYAYRPADDRLAFTARYVPEPQKQGRAKIWHVTYRGTDNAVLATKNLDFSFHGYVPVFKKKLTQSDDVAGIRRDTQGNWQMLKENRSSGEVEVEPFDIAP